MRGGKRHLNEQENNIKIKVYINVDENCVKICAKIIYLHQWLL